MTSSLGEDVEQLQFSVHGRWECKMIQPFRKPVWQFLTELNIYLPYDLGIYPRDMKAYVYTENLYKNVHSCVVRNSQTRDNPIVH